jgi:hypothetical protein
MTARVHVRCTDILYVGVGACACVATRPDTRARARAGARTAQPEPRTFGLAAHLSARLRAGAGRAGSRLSLVARVAGQKARGFLISLQCSTFTGMILVFGVLLILFEWYW